MMMSTFRTVLLVSTALLASGCANLQAVNKTAGDLQSAESTWNSVGDDFLASCNRRNLMSVAPSDCVQEKRASDALEATNRHLAAYFSALQQASDTSNFSVDKDLTGVATAAKDLPGVKGNQIDAVEGFFSWVAGLATHGLEERTVKRLVAEGAPLAIKVLDVLDETVAPELEVRYRDEQRMTRLAFTSYVQQSGTTFNVEDGECKQLSIRSSSTGTAFLLAQAYCSRLAAIDAKRDALTSYQSSLRKARQTLVGLEQGKDDLGAKDLAKQLQSDASALKKDLDGIKKAF